MVLRNSLRSPIEGQASTVLTSQAANPLLKEMAFVNCLLFSVILKDPLPSIGRKQTIWHPPINLIVPPRYLKNSIDDRRTKGTNKMKRKRGNEGNEWSKLEKQEEKRNYSRSVRNKLKISFFQKQT